LALGAAAPRYPPVHPVTVGHPQGSGPGLAGQAGLAWRAGAGLLGFALAGGDGMAAPW